MIFKNSFLLLSVLLILTSCNSKQLAENHVGKNSAYRREISSSEIPRPILPQTPPEPSENLASSQPVPKPNSESIPRPLPNPELSDEIATESETEILYKILGRELSWDDYYFIKYTGENQLTVYANNADAVRDLAEKYLVPAATELIIEKAAYSRNFISLVYDDIQIYISKAPENLYFHFDENGITAAFRDYPEFEEFLQTYEHRDDIEIIPFVPTDPNIKTNPNM